MTVSIRLLGAIEVTGPEQENLTPAGPKIAALLSLVAVANGEVCTREWLQKKLWSDRGVKQAQDSLRHAIKTLKNSLGRYEQVLVVTRKGLSLDRSATYIDLYDKQLLQKSRTPGVFLDRLKIQDKAFNQWLQEKRSEFVSDNSSALALSAVKPVTGINVGILPLVVLNTKLDAQVVGNALISKLGMSLSNLGFINIYDYSGQTSVHSSDESVIEQDAMLLVRCAYLKGSYVLTLSVSCVSSNKVLWGTVNTVPATDEYIEIIPNLVIRFSDQIANTLSNPSVFGDSTRHSAAKLVVSAIDKMFSSSASSLDEAEVALCKAIELEGKGVYYAWYAYLMAFRFEDLKDLYKGEYKAKTHYLLNKAVAEDENNPLTLSLVAHVYSFVFRDFYKAEALLDRALVIDPHSILALDGYAMLNFYRGNLEKARALALQVFQKSMFNPYRFCFATSLCMIDTVMGNYTTAAEYGEQAIAIHRPNQTQIFAPTLRYLSAAHESIGNRERAAEIFVVLKKQDPKFEVRSLLQEDFPVPNRNAASILNKALTPVEVDVGYRITSIV